MSLLGLVSTLGFGCGSRTSMLDEDVYGVGAENVASGSSSHASPSGTAGKPTSGGLLGNGGASSSATSGKGGVSVDPSLAIPPCQKYCPGYGTQCLKRLMGQNCLSTCQGELNGSGAECQALGISALTCLTPFSAPTAARAIRR